MRAWFASAALVASLWLAGHASAQNFTIATGYPKEGNGAGTLLIKGTTTLAVNSVSVFVWKNGGKMGKVGQNLVVDCKGEFSGSCATQRGGSGDTVQILITADDMISRYKYLLAGKVK